MCYAHLSLGVALLCWWWSFLILFIFFLLENRSEMISCRLHIHAYIYVVSKSNRSWHCYCYDERLTAVIAVFIGVLLPIWGYNP